MGDDEITRERQRLLDEVEECNELLARMSVATLLPMSAALRCTMAELRFEVPALWRRYLDLRHKLEGSM